MKNFSLSLYAFHLRHPFVSEPGKPGDDASLLWENLANLGKGFLQFPELKDLRSNLICYQNSTYNPQGERSNQWLTHSETALDLGSIPTQAGYKINGNLQPFRLNDTYAADLTLLPELRDIDIDPPQLKDFNPQGCLLPPSIQASLGQTLWIYGEVDKTDSECETLAKQYTVALLAGTGLNESQVKKGKLFGSLLFEWEVTAPTDCDNLSKQCHILVSINNTKADTERLATEAYDWMRDFLCCRHKIRYIQHQASERYPQARALYTKLESKIQDFYPRIAKSENPLSDLKDLLTETPIDSLNYEICLRDLKTHRTAIATNISNCRTCQEKIKSSQDQLEVWDNFIELTCKLYLSQIETNISYLSPGQELFAQMINTFRGLIEIEQTLIEKGKEEAEKLRNEKLQNTIQALGAGVGVAGIIASSYQFIEQKPWQWQLSLSLPPHPFVGSVGLSFVFGFLTWVIAKAWLNRATEKPQSLPSQKPQSLPPQNQQSL